VPPLSFSPEAGGAGSRCSVYRGPPTPSVNLPSLLLPPGTCFIGRCHILSCRCLPKVLSRRIGRQDVSLKGFALFARPRLCPHNQTPTPSRHARGAGLPVRRWFPQCTRGCRSIRFLYDPSNATWNATKSSRSTSPSNSKSNASRQAFVHSAAVGVGASSGPAKQSARAT
jgi:hypothetical protein